MGLKQYMAEPSETVNQNKPSLLEVVLLGVLVTMTW